jgi:hypothetical protein
MLRSDPGAFVAAGYASGRVVEQWAGRLGLSEEVGVPTPPA